MTLLVGAIRVRLDVVAWGIALIAIGGAIALLGCGFLTDYRGIADSYYWWLVASRRPGNRFVGVGPVAFRRLLGIPAIMLGLLIAALGAYGVAHL
jgi:hypothetical protein